MKNKLLIICVLLISGFFLSGCTSSNSNYYYDDNSYEEYEEEPVTSDNWDCTGDCSGHDAGYEWAGENGIEDPDDCGGNSDSFIEGCEAYANEQNINNYEYEMEEDYSEEEYDY